MDKKKLIKALVNRGEDISDVYEDDKVIQVATDFEAYYLYKHPFAYLDEIFEFNSCDINKERFFNIIRKLDEGLFVAVNKVIFVNSVKEYDKLNEYHHESLDLTNEFGKFCSGDNSILINMYKIKRRFNRYAKNNSSKFEELVNRELFITLLHELKHIVQSHPVYDDDLAYDNDYDDEEEDAEFFACDLFDVLIQWEDFYVLNTKKVA